MRQSRILFDFFFRFKEIQNEEIHNLKKKNSLTSVKIRL